ncbi:MAG: DUF882 domain-containing protein [Pseudomonadota bacterium]
MGAGARVMLALVSISIFGVAALGEANAQTRSLSLYNTHTEERLTVTYKRNGRFVQNGLNQLNRFLRDWRRDEVTRMDPALFDIVWNVYRDVKATQPIHVVSAYRSPTTNAMLRRRSSGVARNSQHTRGNAIDFFIPGVPASQLRAAGLRQQQGGVGYYPRSNTPFVHLDTGTVRMWPRMTRSQLARVFPNGRTIHIPADGRPMSGFEQAQRDLQRGGGNRSTVVATAQSSPSSRGGNSSDVVLPGGPGEGNIFAGLFRGGSDDEATSSGAPAAASPRRSVRQDRVEVAAATPASTPRDRFAAPSPVLPPNVAAETSIAEEAIASLAVPSPVPAPTLDELQIAALNNASPAPETPAVDTSADAAAPGAISAAFAAAQSVPSTSLPPISREQQIAQTVPAPGQIAAILEARFAEQRTEQATLRAQVEASLARAGRTPAPAEPTAAPIQLSDAQPRFAPPIPQPVQATAEVSPQVTLASLPTPAPLEAAPTPDLATAFASPESTAGDAQNAIAALATGNASTLGPERPSTTASQPVSPDITTGSTVATRIDQVWRASRANYALALTKGSIRARSGNGLVAPQDVINLTPTVLHDSGFSASRPFGARAHQFERRDLTSTFGDS